MVAPKRTGLLPLCAEIHTLRFAIKFGFVIVSIFFFFLSITSNAWAANCPTAVFGGAPQPDWSADPNCSMPRPDPSSFRYEAAPNQTLVGAPAGFTCRVSSQGPNPGFMCVNGNQWSAKYCHSVPGDLGTNGDVCSICSGTGNSGTCGRYVEHSGTLGTSHDETPNVDPSTGALQGTTARNSSAVGSVFNVIAGITLEAVASLIWFFTEFIVWLCSLLLFIIAGFFDYVVVQFVVEMGKFITSESANAIRTAWTTIRDIANIAIIGGLVATAIGTIIGSEKYSVQKTLARLILAALLVNFSYFAAGAVIDFSNFTAAQAYKYVINTPGCEQRDECGIAHRIFAVTEIYRIRDAQVIGNTVTNLFGARQGANSDATVAPTDDTGDQLNSALSPSQAATRNIMTIIFMGVTTFVFLSAISLLVARFVVLIFLLVTSPIGIAGGAVPILKTYADEWWKALWSQAFFAPAYFLLAGIALNILDGIARTVSAYTGDTPGINLNDSIQGIVSVMAMFTIAIGFMYAALAIAKSMSAEAKRFADVYKATAAGANWLMGAGRYAGGIALREGLGQLAYRGAFMYNRYAGERRWDVNGVLGSKALGRVLDRTAKGILQSGQNAKFLADAKSKTGIKKSFAELEKEKRERQIELGNIAREQEQDGKLIGKLTGKDKKEYDRLNKAARLSAAEEKEWDELRRVAREGNLNKADKDRLHELRLKKASNKKLTAKEKDDLKQLSKADLMTLDQSNRLAVLDGAKKQKLKDAKEDVGRWVELDNVVAGGGALGRLISAEDKLRDRYNEGVYRKQINEKADYESLKARQRSGTLTKEEERALKYYQDRENDQAKYEALKAKRNLGPLDRTDSADLAALEKKLGVPSARMRDLESRKDSLTGTELEELKHYQALSNNGFKVQDAVVRENDASYFARQSRMTETYRDADGKEKTIEWGRKRGETATAYYARLDKESGYRKARADAEAIEATLPKDFLQRKYAEDPRKIIPYARVLDAETFNSFMKNDDIARDIKREMRIARNGDYMNNIREIENKVATGEVVRGSEEYQDLLGAAFYYTTKRLKNNDEYVDMVLSPQGEDLRKLEALTNGGSRTGAWNALKSKLGTTESRELAGFKRSGYLTPQKKLGAVAILEGWENKDAEGNPVENYYLRYQGGSDNFDEALEVREWAEKERGAAEKKIARSDITVEDKQEAYDTLRFTEMVLGKRKNPLEGIEPGEKRTAAIAQAKREVDSLWNDVKEGRKTKDEVMDTIRADDRLFVAHQEQQARSDLQGFAGGKNAQEIAALTSMERTFSRAIAVGNDAGRLVTMMDDGNYDGRFRKAIRRSFFIEKPVNAVMEIASNQIYNAAFGGWPDAEEIKEINRLRRINAGFDKDIPNPSIDIPEVPTGLREEDTEDVSPSRPEPDETDGSDGATEGLTT